MYVPHIPYMVLYLREFSPNSVFICNNKQKCIVCVYRGTVVGPRGWVS